MPKKDFSVEVRPGSHVGSVIISVSGPLVLEHLFRFQEEWESHQEPLIILDVSRMSYIDSASLGFLVKAYVSLEKNGKKLALAGVTGFVQQILSSTNVGNLFSTYQSIEDAEMGFANSRGATRA